MSKKIDDHENSVGHEIRNAVENYFGKYAGQEAKISLAFQMVAQAMKSDDTQVHRECAVEAVDFLASSRYLRATSSPS